mmetsp:Transcript_34744/g.92644  ORF Transcript_34744/g.92644 Transcript_34744/m.92644 type:complete len:104 (+) Transcript_34744:704-1015(+)
MVLEAHCCPVLSALATRYEIQDQFQIKRSCLEKTCVGVLCLCDCFAVCCRCKDSCCYEVGHALAHCLLCVVLPCMVAQGKHQLGVEKKDHGQFEPALNAALIQ